MYITSEFVRLFMIWVQYLKPPTFLKLNINVTHCIVLRTTVENRDLKLYTFSVLYGYEICYHTKGRT
jgi:hypothetical protein